VRRVDDVRVLDRAGVPIAVLGGEIDLTNAAEIRDKIFAAASPVWPGLVLDLSGVTFLGSRGVQLILELADRLKMRQLPLRIALPEQARVRRVLRLIHVDEIVPFDATVEEAVAQIRKER
jgi:anti-sigma B factor antagonist